MRLKKKEIINKIFENRTQDLDYIKDVFNEMTNPKYKSSGVVLLLVNYNLNNSKI